MKHAFLSAMSRFHNWVYASSGGSIGGSIGAMPVLLLTTTGRKSQETRTIPITYFRDGKNYAVVAANGGSERPPGWWLNLQANPVGQIQIGKQQASVRGREATPEETARIWPTLPSSYGDLQGRTKRHIPIVILEPTGF